jgi:hypothetical protein
VQIDAENVRTNPSISVMNDSPCQIPACRRDMRGCVRDMDAGFDEMGRSPSEMGASRRKGSDSDYEMDDWF